MQLFVLVPFLSLIATASEVVGVLVPLLATIISCVYTYRFSYREHWSIHSLEAQDYLKYEDRCKNYYYNYYHYYYCFQTKAITSSCPIILPTTTTTSSAALSITPRPSPLLSFPSPSHPSPLPSSPSQVYFRTHTRCPSYFIGVIFAILWTYHGATLLNHLSKPRSPVITTTNSPITTTATTTTSPTKIGSSSSSSSSSNSSSTIISTSPLHSSGIFALSDSWRKEIPPVMVSLALSMSLVLMGLTVYGTLTELKDSPGHW